MSAAAPPAADAADVIIRLPGGERRLTPEDISAAVDRPAGTYLLRARGTRAEAVAHPPALSMRKLVTLAGGSPDSVSFVSLTRPNGSLALLRGPDLADPPPFPEGPPIVWVDQGQIRYLRPLRGPDDANAADNIGITEGNLVVRAHQGPLLEVRATANRQDVPAGTPVRFSAEVVGDPVPGRSLTFTWSLGDGTRKEGAAIRHAYDEPGVYEAVVTVSGSDDSGGSSAPLRLTVGDPPQDNGAPGGGRRDPGQAPAQGPAESPGSDGGAPYFGGSAPYSGGSAPSSGGSAPYYSPAPPATSGVTPASPTTPGGQPTPPVGRESTSQSQTADELVRGTLVAADTATRLPGGSAAAGGVAAARRGSELTSSGLGPLAGILAATALVGLGIRRERRATRRKRPEVKP